MQRKLKEKLNLNTKASLADTFGSGAP